MRGRPSRDGASVSSGLGNVGMTLTELIMLATFGISLVTFWFGMMKWVQNGHRELRQEMEGKDALLERQVIDSVNNLAEKIDDVRNNYVHKDELRNTIAFQTDLLKEVRSEQGRMNKRFDDFMLMQMKKGSTP